MINGPSSLTFMPKIAIQAVLAARLKAARAALGLSQAAVGVRMVIPEETASARVNRWEKSVHPTSLENAEQLAEALGVPLPALVCRDDRLAAVIAGFDLLPKARQDEVWALIEQALGAEQAEAVSAKLALGTPPATKVKKGRDRGL